MNNVTFSQEQHVADMQTLRTKVVETKTREQVMVLFYQNDVFAAWRERPPYDAVKHEFVSYHEYNIDRFRELLLNIVDWHIKFHTKNL